MAVGPAPPATFGMRSLVLREEPPGAVWRRLYGTRHPNPLGFRRAPSRFSDPTGGAFGLIYVGSSVRVAFHEVILRDRADARTGPVLVPYAELEAYSCGRSRLRLRSGSST